MKKSINIIFIVLTVIFCISSVFLGIKIFTMKSENTIKLNGKDTGITASKIKLGDKNYVAVEPLNRVCGIDYKLSDGELNMVTEDLSIMSEEKAFALAYTFLHEFRDEEYFENYAVYAVEETEDTFKITKTVSEEVVNNFRERVKAEIGEDASKEEIERYISGFKTYEYAIISKSQGRVIEVNGEML